jgi:mRNA-degrading endonuclease RelE of RelBE toxin-antitoxin system
MIYQIKFSEEALKDIERLKESGNKSIIKEISRSCFFLDFRSILIQELVR